MSGNDHIEKDDRFKHIAKDPRFRRMRKDDHKVKIDKRFKDMFKDKRFSDKAEIDKRGRPIDQGQSKSDLQRYYRVSDDDDEDDDDSDDDARGPIVDRTNEPDFARGEGLESSSSSEDDEEEEEGEVEETDGIDLSQAWGELDHDAETGEETSRRLALCNMDWDRIKAVDILVLCNSFAPKDGTIEKVTILPSEFGKERIKQEDFSGPSELRKSTPDDDDDNNNDDDPDAEVAQQRKLRQYQLNRLKYFYAVIECDSVATAERVYADLDGHDYESSGTRIDLRFIPDDMTFDDDPKDICTTLPSADSVYEPEAFVTKALHQSKVECTWDETDRERTKVTRRKFGKEELEALDLKDYLASSSSEDEGVGGDEEGDGKPMTKESRIQMYRKLIQGIENVEEGEKKKKLKAGELQVTFEPGLKEKAEKLVQNKLSGETSLDEKKNKKGKKGKKAEEEEEDDDDDIPEGIDLNDPYFAEELAEVKGGGGGSKDAERTKEKKKKLKKKKGKKEGEKNEEEEKEEAELRLLLSDDEDTTKGHFDMKKIVKKESISKKKAKKLEKEGKKEKADKFDIDLNDVRFAALSSDPNFNIDQSNPNFKRTKSSVALLNNKLTKRSREGESTSGGKKKKKKLQ